MDSFELNHKKNRILFEWRSNMRSFYMKFTKQAKGVYFVCLLAFNIRS